MSVRNVSFLFLLGWIVGAIPPSGLAQPAKGNPKDMAAIAKNGEAYVEAFHKADAKALAAFWVPDGDYTDQTGKVMKGRDAIEKAFQGFFAEHKGLKVHIDSISLRFLTPDVAVEDGISETIPADGAPPSRARYTIVHVKKDGQWLLGSVRDAPYTPPGNFEHLRGLAGAIGDWSGEADNGATERLSVSWAENQNFVHATFTTTIKNISVGSAHQWIGWDPIGKHIRSWIFDASGGFGEGTWSHDGKKWTVKTASVLQDGKKATATYVLALVDADTITLQSKDRTVDGTKIPDSKEIKLKRVK
jgi:uncharacterized protein (TIGR02246 family)